MKLLGMDTSSDACSVGVYVDGEVDAEHVLEPRAHTRLLVPMIRRRLAAAGLDVGDLDAIVLGEGPGSFIGVRIAASVAQGLAFGAGLGIVPVSSLAAIAAQVFATSQALRVVVTQDARMDEVYRAQYRRDEFGLPLAEGETVLETVAGAQAASDAVYAGGGWSKYPAMRDALPAGATVVPVLQPHARHLLACGRRALDAGAAVDPGDLELAYVRQRVAAVPAGGYS